VTPINWQSFFFLLFALASCGFAVAVVLSSNIVRMAFYLILSLGATAGLFFLAGADFVGAMQLLIYVGGTLVLLVFGVMLTAQGPFISLKTRGGDWILACLLSGCLLATLVPAAFSVPSWRNQPAEAAADSHAAEGQAANAHAAKPEKPAVTDSSPYQEDTSARIGMGLLGVRVDKLEDRPQALVAGMSGYLLPFEIVSIHLLVVLIGAAYLARAKRRARGSMQ
jgi:NADH:ubiquinone oxidoreductase subunit 6 (subunit J)